MRPEVIIATPDLAGRARDLQEAAGSIRATIGIGAGHGLDHDYEQVLGRATPFERPLRDPDEAVLVCSTSGTSGTPKAVVHTQRTTATGYRPLIDRFEVDDGSHVVTGLPMYFATAYSGWTLSFVAGAQQSMIPAFDPRSYVDLVEAVQGTHAFLGPAPVNYIIDAGIDLASARVPALPLDGWSTVRPDAPPHARRCSGSPGRDPVRHDRSVDRDFTHRIGVHRHRRHVVTALPLDWQAVRGARRASRRRRTVSSCRSTASPAASSSSPGAS